MFLRQDLVSDLKVAQALAFATISSSTTTAGAIIDTSTFQSVAFLLSLGTRTDGTYTVLIEEGNDSGLSDAATVAAANLIAPNGLVANTSSSVLKVGYVVGKYRYVRLSVVSTVVTSGCTHVGAIVLRSTPNLAAVA